MSEWDAVIERGRLITILTRFREDSEGSALTYAGEPPSYTRALDGILDGWLSVVAERDAAIGLLGWPSYEQAKGWLHRQMAAVGLEQPASDLPETTLEEAAVVAAASARVVRVQRELLASRRDQRGPGRQRMLEAMLSDAIDALERAIA